MMNAEHKREALIRAWAGYDRAEALASLESIRNALIDVCPNVAVCLASDFDIVSRQINRREER